MERFRIEENVMSLSIKYSVNVVHHCVGLCQIANGNLIEQLMLNNNTSSSSS